MANYYSARAYLSKARHDLEIAKNYASRLASVSSLKSARTELSVLITSLDKAQSALRDKFDENIDYSMFRICEPERSEELYRASFIYGVVCNVNDTLKRACCLSDSKSSDNEHLSNKLIEKNVNEALYAVNVILKEQEKLYSESTEPQKENNAQAHDAKQTEDEIAHFDKIEKAIQKGEYAAESADSRISRMRILDHVCNIQIWRELIDNELERLDESIIDSRVTHSENS